MTLLAKKEFCLICGGFHPKLVKEIYGTTCLVESMIQKADKIRNEGGLVYFIEHKETRLWWFQVINPDSFTVSNKEITIPQSSGTYLNEWTNDPLKCYAFPTYEDADRMRILCGEDYNNTFVTEHLFNE